MPKLGGKKSNMCLTLPCTAKVAREPGSLTKCHHNYISRELTRVDLCLLLAVCLFPGVEEPGAWQTHDGHECRQQGELASPASLLSTPAALSTQPFKTVSPGTSLPWAFPSSGSMKFVQHFKVRCSQPDQVTRSSWNCSKILGKIVHGGTSCPKHTWKNLANGICEFGQSCRGCMWIFL